MSAHLSLANRPVRPASGERPSRRHALAGWRRWLPTGDTLPDASHRVRHRQICAVLWAHAVGLFAYAAVLVARGGDVHLLAEVGLVGLLAFGASRAGLSKKASSVVSTLGLFVSSAVLTHMAHGLIEAHFHFFVMVVVVSLYQSWLPFLVGLGFVLVHHGVGGAMPDNVVFDHAGGASEPWTWAVVHALFILGESIACLVAWRVNEDALSRERQGRELLEKANEDLALAQELSRVGSWEVDVTAETLVWSREMYRMLDVDPDVQPSYGLLLEHTHPEDRLRVAAEVGRMFTADGPVEFEHRMLGGDREITVRARSMPVLRDGVLVKLAGTFQDITENRRLEREIEHRAFHDPLTNLGNRALFMDRLTHALAVRERSDAPLTVLYMDIDDFKTVNDSMGHAAGDALLVAIGRRLTETVRPGDTVARLGGDEFALLLENTDVAGGERTAARILESLALPVAVEHRSIAVRASIGVADTVRGTTPGEVLRNADIAMYAAKREGKAGYRAYAPHMLASVVDRMERIADLRAAVDTERFTLHYQPVIDLTTGEVRGVEALARWTHPRLGNVPPLEFIPLAEETGLIVPLGEWVLRTATRDVRAMQEHLGRRLQLSVNVSAVQFATDVVSLVSQALDESGLAPEDLVLEITESCLVDPDDLVIDQLTALRDRGVRVAIDDFGTGYSSMSYLRDLPIDVLKIDRSFIRHVTEGGDHSALAQAIITVGQAFHLETVAEGIETEAQAAQLSHYGCQAGQGYLYARPQPLKELLTTLTDTEAGSALAEAV